ncbi:hypothetical protein [Streptomyces prasinopilosus]|uniref:hypothetical protein n=1 Tax=Streptomyces prasinopilosus TaxID=67344 RepID=UPI0006EBA05B|nr:hypothetical protein [Streptomyces prasinopilosus]
MRREYAGRQDAVDPSSAAGRRAPVLMVPGGAGTVSARRLAPFPPSMGGRRAEKHLDLSCRYFAP